MMLSFSLSPHSSYCHNLETWHIYLPCEYSIFHVRSSSATCGCKHSHNRARYHLENITKLSGIKIPAIEIQINHYARLVETVIKTRRWLYKILKTQSILMVVVFIVV